MKPIKFESDWEFNVLGIENFKKTGPRDAYFNFIRSNYSTLEGDIVESGVFRGRSLLATALLLKELKSSKKIYGFDSFGGFPPIYHKNDDVEAFLLLRDEGRISEEHYNAVVLNQKIKNFLSNVETNVATISNSSDFSDTSKDILLKKIEFLGLDNIIIVEGNFEDTMVSTSGPEKIFACMMDCDLYQSYLSTFNFVWPKLIKGGFIYLDEYFALKFPGGRMATDEFLKNKPHKLKSYKSSPSDLFERWFVTKTD
jgi:hypothetical protein